MDSVTEHRAIVDTHRHPVGPKLAAKTAARRLYDPKQELPQANLLDFVHYRDFVDLDYSLITKNSSYPAYSVEER